MAANTENGVEDKKPGIVRKISKITFTIGPIRQEDLSTNELNRLMAMAQRFEINFDTAPVLDSNQTEKLGYMTLPFEIRSQDYLLVLYDRLHNLKLGHGEREVSIKFPDELRRHIDELRAHNAEMKKKRIEERKENEEKMRRSLYATFVDKDTGRESLVEKFPEAKEIIVRQHNFQWFGCMEFESSDKALEVLKKGKEIEIEGQKVKIVRTPPDHEEKQKQMHQNSNRGRPASSPSGRGGGGGFGHNRGGFTPRPLLGSPGGGYGGNFAGGRGAFNQGYTQGFNQGGGFQRGGKRKSDMDDFSGHAKRQFGNQRGGWSGGGGGYGGGYGGGRGGGNRW